MHEYGWSDHNQQPWSTEKNNKNHNGGNKEELHYKRLAWQTPNNGGLASHSYERLYGIDGDKRKKGIDKRGEENNGHRKRFFLMWDKRLLGCIH